MSCWASRVAVSIIKSSYKQITSGVRSRRLWDQDYLTSSSTIWMMGQQAPSASLQMIQNREPCLIHQQGLCYAGRLHRLQKWANKNLMHLNKGKCHVLRLHLTISQQHVPAAKHANSFWDCLMQIIASRSREGIPALSSVLVRQSQRAESSAELPTKRES